VLKEESEQKGKRKRIRKSGEEIRNNLFKYKYNNHYTYTCNVTVL
jgi:hypothetical protein